MVPNASLFGVFKVRIGEVWDVTIAGTLFKGIRETTVPWYQATRILWF